MFAIKIKDNLFCFDYEADAIEQFMIWFRKEVEFIYSKKDELIIEFDEDTSAWLKDDVFLYQANKLAVYFGSFSVLDNERQSVVIEEREQNQKNLLVIVQTLKDFSEKTHFNSLKVVDEEFKRMKQKFYSEFEFDLNYCEFNIFYNKVYSNQSILETLKQEKGNQKNGNP
jgi:hypothetical protein